MQANPLANSYLLPMAKRHLQELCGTSISGHNTYTNMFYVHKFTYI